MIVRMIVRMIVALQPSVGIEDRGERIVRGGGSKAEEGGAPPDVQSEGLLRARSVRLRHTEMRGDGEISRSILTPPSYD